MSPTFLFTVFVLFPVVIASPQSYKKNSIFKFSLHKHAPAPHILVSELQYGRAEYYAEVSIGTPRQVMNLHVNTGTSVTWVRCNPCLFSGGNCATNEFYGDECRYRINYRDDNVVEMVMGLDTFSLIAGDLPTGGSWQEILEVQFGCALYSKLEGSLGLGLGKLSFYTKLKDNYGVKMFSYCLLDQVNNKNDTSDILFGEHPVSGDTLYTPMIQSDERYAVMLSGISIHGETMESAGFPIKMVLDTGTTNTHLPESVFKALSTTIQGAVDKLAWGRAIRVNDIFPCYIISQKQMSESPTITLTFNGNAELELLPHYIWHYLPKYQVACFSFKVASDGLNIIGSMQQQGTRIIIDQRNEDRIGFERSAC